MTKTMTASGSSAGVPLSDAYLIQPQTLSPQDLSEWLHAFYADTEPFPDDFLVERDDQPPQERDWSGLAFEEWRI